MVVTENLDVETLSSCIMYQVIGMPGSGLVMTGALRNVTHASTTEAQRVL